MTFEMVRAENFCQTFFLTQIFNFHFLTQITSIVTEFITVLCLYIGGGWMIYHFSNIVVQFVFLSIEFHCTFSIFYKILPYFVYYTCILVGM